jgi:hypothetical protein
LKATSLEMIELLTVDRGHSAPAWGRLFPQRRRASRRHEDRFGPDEREGNRRGVPYDERDKFEKASLETPAPVPGVGEAGTKSVGG